MRVDTDKGEVLIQVMILSNDTYTTVYEVAPADDPMRLSARVKKAAQKAIDVRGCE